MSDSLTILPPPSPASPEKPFQSYREEMLEVRFKAKSKFEKELTFEFTHDRGFLHQYYKLRAKELNDVFGLDGYPDQETESDREAQILIVRMGNFCVGGMALHIKTAKKNKPLPMEKHGFLIEHHFPELGYKQQNYAQLSRMAILPEFRRGDVAYHITKRIYKKSIASNIKQIFCVSTLKHDRFYRYECSVLGLQNTKVHEDIALPHYDAEWGTKMYLLSIPIERPETKKLEKATLYQTH